MTISFPFRASAARCCSLSVAPLLALALLHAAPPAQSAVAASLKVERLRCEYADAPLGIDALHPRLSWILRSDRRGQRQTAYQILVASDEKLLKAGQGDLWDSGKIDSDQTTAIPYNGKPLQTGQRCWWAVRVWDAEGGVTSYSSPALWEMGLLQPSDLTARWITLESPTERQGDPFGPARWIWHEEGSGGNAPAGERFFRLRFEVKAPLGASDVAQLRLSADDQFTVYVNGREAGKSSGQTDAWRAPSTLDLRPFLRPGANVLAISARNETTSPAGLIAHLRITGTPDLFTDGSWKTAATAPSGWQSPDFSDDTWQAANVAANYGASPWGKFRSGPLSGPGRYLRRAFEVSKPIRRARLYASALGVYEPYLNGKRIGKDIFAPGWTDYRKRVYYQTYDVTSALRRGSNALGLILGDGWYSGHVGLAGRGVYGPTPLAWCQLRIEYTDGSAETLTSDEKWRGSLAGPVVTTDLLQGENYDARREAAFAKWSEPGYADTDWQAAQVGDPKAGRLEAQRGPSVRSFEELRPKSVTNPRPGVAIFDLGQNMVGWVRLKTRGGAAGDKITLRFAEMLNPDGSLYTTNYRGARCIDTYTLRGNKGGETYEPHFTFRGFRYVEISGWPEGAPAPGADAITGVVVNSDTPRVGQMETSAPMVNQLLKNIDWGQRGNFLTVPTDCPQRDERLGWMGDAQIFVATAAYNRDVAGFFDKWLTDVDDAQSAAGAFSDVAPRVAVGDGTAAWGDAGVICPWTLYQAYGDPRFLSDHYPAMVRWVEYCRKNSNGLLRPASGYGDWLSIKADTPKDVLATAYFAYSTQLVARAAKALGKTEDAAHFEALFNEIRDAYQKAYVSPDGKIKGDTQTVYLLSLRFNLLPEALRPVVADRLTRDIQARNNHLSTGFVGVGYLCPVLADAGKDDMAYRLLHQDTFPSWGYSIRQGATTIWERWDGWTEDKGFQDPGMNSFNHYSFGSVGEWLYGYVAGIRPDPSAPGYRRILIQPRPGGGMTWTRTSFDSIQGPIRTEWKQESGKYDLRVEVPANTTATVWVATSDASRVTEGGVPANRANGVRFLRTEPGYAVYEVGGGSYRFTSP